MTKWVVIPAFFIAFNVFALFGGESGASVASDGAGNFYAVWGGLNSSGNEVIQTATFTAGGSWSTPPTPLSSSTHDAIFPQIAVASNGAAAIIWYDIDELGVASVMGSFLPAGSSTWSDAEPISLSTDNEPYEDSLDVSLGISGTIIDPITTATVVWKFIDSDNHEITKASQTTDGTWSTPVQISTVP